MSNNKGMVVQAGLKASRRTTDEILVQFVGNFQRKGYGFKLNNGTEVHNGNFVNEGLIEQPNKRQHIYLQPVLHNTTENLQKYPHVQSNGF